MAAAISDQPVGPRGWSALWNRQLDTYPDTRRRYMYLAITVLATITLYYELYVAGSVSILFLPKLHMSFTFYVYTVGISNLIGACGSLFAGLTDRIGRTNLVVVGLIVAGVFIAVVIPSTTTKWPFTIASWVVALVEGVCLVATPALIRDFSPQVGRASAMGFWTSGPVLGSLAVSIVATNTIGPHPSNSFWTHQYHIAGIVGLVVAALAVIGLRELAPGLRDQLMVTMRDRALIQARAKGLDIEASLRRPWRQLLKPEILVAALGISVFLVFYYTAVVFGLIYYSTIFGFSAKAGNGIGNWTWGLNVVAVIAFGFISDVIRVRKPLAILGGVASAVMMVLYLSQIGHHPSYYHLALLAGFLSFFQGVAYVPWMASFTETVEARNPALTATGLAIWGWTIRVIVFVAAMIMPSIISSLNPLVTYGGQVQAIVKEYPGFNAGPTVLAELRANPTNPEALAAAHQILGPDYIQELLAVQKAPAATIEFMTAHAGSVLNADKRAPNEWRTWYWVCFGCMIFFLFTVPLLRGRWSPKQARADEVAHEEMIRAEMEKLGLTTSV